MIGTNDSFFNAPILVKAFGIDIQSTINYKVCAQLSSFTHKNVSYALLQHFQVQCSENYYGKYSESNSEKLVITMETGSMLSLKDVYLLVKFKKNL